MVIKINKRIFATTIGIALCVMYLVGTMSMVSGLHVGTKRAADLFEQGFVLVFDGYTLSESEMKSDIIDNIPGEYAACLIFPVRKPAHLRLTIDGRLTHADLLRGGAA